MEEAKELFEKAAGSYKVAQQWEKAVDCYMRCIECEEDEGTCATYYGEAAKCMKKVNTNKFLELAEKAINAYCMG
jgi:alpha-soluble NSF attachment protein